MTPGVVPLDPDEEVLWSGRPRLATVIPAAIVGLVLAAAPLAAAVVTDEPLLALLTPTGLALSIWAYLTVTHTEFLVTDRALYRKTGVLGRNVRRIGVDRVQNSSYTQGLLGALFGYGTVDVEAAGGGRIRFDDIEEPLEVRALVDRSTDTDTLPGSAAQWEAVLAEVRALRRVLAVE